MAVTTTKTNKPINPRGNDQSPKGYNRAALYSGKALDFDGVNDYVAIAYDASTRPTSEITLTAIAKMDWSSSTQTRILSCTEAGGYNISVGEGSFIPTGNTGMLLRLSSSGYTAVYISNTTIPDGYNAISSTFDGRYLKLYLNGTLVATTDSGETQSIYYAYNNSLFVGAEASSGATPAGSGYWNGEISNVRLFDVALTAAQVSDLYNNPEKIVPTGVSNTALKLWLPMMEGAGTTAYDGSGNGNHGTISGATYVNGVGAPVAQSAVMDWNKGTNLISDSEDFSQWSNVSQFVIYSTDDTTAPDGQTTADKITEDTSSNHHRFYKQIVFGTESGSNQSYTISGFVKYIDRQYISIGLSDNSAYNGLVNFDLINGTIGGEYSYNGSTISNKTITSVGNDWWKFSVTITSPTWAGGSIYAIAYLQQSSSVSLGAYLGESKSVHVWGWNVAKENYTTSYIPTFGTAQSSEVLLPQGLTSGRDITGVNLFENVRKQGALNLDGNSWAEVHDNASVDLTDGISLECWYYNDGSTDKGLLGKYYSGKLSYLLWVSTTQNAVRIFTNNLSSEKTGLSLGWHHVVGTYDGANRKIYVDGVLGDTGVYTTDMATSDEAIEIGRYFGTSTTAFANQIAQPRIYNRALTAEEVQRNYDAGKNIYTNS